MTKTLRGDKKEYKWTNRVDNSFETLKYNAAKLPIVDFSYFNKVFQVECDASGSPIGAILSQEGKHVAFLVKS